MVDKCGNPRHAVGDLVDSVRAHNLVVIGGAELLDLGSLLRSNLLEALLQPRGSDGCIVAGSGGWLEKRTEERHVHEKKHW